MTRKYSAAVIAFLFRASQSRGFAHSLALGNSRQPYISGRSFSTTARSRSRSMTMYIDDMMPMTSINAPPLLPSFPDSASVASKSLNILSAAYKLIPSNPQLEVEILNDASLVALDASAFLSSNTAWLRLCNVIGRMLVLSEDCIRHDHVATIEWVFQVSMLAVSCHALAKSAWPLAMASFSVSTLTVRDRRTYVRLFRAGLTILQFKTLLASSTLEWVEYGPSTLVELSGEYMYFIYSGEAGIQVAVDTIITESTNSSGGGGLCISTRIFGDVQFTKAIDASFYKKCKKSSKRDKMSTGTRGQDTSDSATGAPQGSFVIGPNGASILRISTPKLLQLAENDDELSSSIQRLILLCMQEKLSRRFQMSGLHIIF